MAKVIQAAFGSGCMTKTKAVFQWDNGDKLKFLNADLPATYSVHFANSLSGQATTVIGDESGVEIPPQYFVPGSEIYAWVYISDSNGGYTKYQATIPVWKRAQPSDHTPTPAQQDVIDQAITLLNEATSVIMSSQFKESLLQLARKVAYIDGNGQTYYDDLYNALYPMPTWNVTNTLTRCTTSNPAEVVPQDGPYSATITANLGYTLYDAAVVITMGGNDVTNTAYANGSINIPNVTGDLVITVVAAAKVLSSISAVYNQGGTVYDTDTLDSIKEDLVVTATYSDSTTDTVTTYTLSGTLTAGTSTITVSYGGKTTTFNVTVTSTYLFSIANRAMTVDEQINTDVDLISADMDFSICIDVAFTQVNNEFKICYQFENASPWRGITFGTGSSNTFNCKYINAYETLSNAASSLTKVKAVISHTSGSGKALCYYRLNADTSTSSVTVNNAFVSLNPGNTLRIGKHSTNTWAGTINRFDIRSFAFTQSQAESFIAGE